MTQTDLAPLSLSTLYLDTGGENLNEVNKSYLRPIGIGSLFDFLGVQFASYNGNGTPNIGYNTSNPNIELNINLLPFLAYNRIYDDWYRNERTQQARLYYYYNNAASSQRVFTSSYRYDQESLILFCVITIMISLFIFLIVITRRISLPLLFLNL